MPNRFSIFLVAASLAAATPAFSGEMQDFEKNLRDVYGSYRVALFATNSGKRDASAKAVEGFLTGWTVLSAQAVPPQYADDPHFIDVMEKVATIAEASQAKISENKLGEAHEVLEGIRDEISALHMRNGISSFSDRMNAYHAQMETVIGLAASDAGTVREAAAILAYLFDDLHKRPPADMGPDFEELLAAVAASIKALRTAALTGDETQIRTAIGQLKAPYSRLFVKYG